MTGTVTAKYRYDDFGKLKEIQKFNTAEETGKENSSVLDALGNLFGITNSKDQEQNQNQNPGYHEFFAYNAESYNPNTEMQYLRARYYKPETANFLTEDSYLGDILKPLTLNRYNYCAGNPVNYKDPSGNVILEAILIGAVVGAVAGAAIEVYKGVKEYQNQDPQDKKDLSTFLKNYDYASAAWNVAYGALSGVATGVGAALIGATAGATVGAVAGGAIGGGVHELLTSTTEVVKEKA